MSHTALEKLKSHLRDGVLFTHDHRGDETAYIEPSMIRAACLFLRDTPGLEFEMLTDLTVADYLGREQLRTPTRPADGKRFEVVYHLFSVEHRMRLRLKVGLDGPDPAIDSIADIWANANWCEREAWDLYGVAFRGHPDLRRILLYEQFEGHPLRKDYPKEKRQPLSRRPRKEIDFVLGKRGTKERRNLV